MTTATTTRRGRQGVSDPQAEMLKSGFFTRYPANVTFRDIYYFAFSPTLCYDIAFPRL